jgi:hypothetical protein
MKTTFDFLSLISSYSLPEFTPSEKGAMRGGGGGGKVTEYRNDRAIPIIKG